MNQSEQDKTCPQCRYKAQKALTEHRNEVEQAYGEVEPHQWYRMRQAVPVSSGEHRTLGHEIKVQLSSDGHLTIYYRCHCHKCGFDHIFQHDDTVPPPKEDGPKGGRR